MHNYLQIEFLDFYHLVWYKNGKLFMDTPIDDSDGFVDYMEGYRSCLGQNNIPHTWKEIKLSGYRKSHGFIGYELPKEWLGECL